MVQEGHVIYWETWRKVAIGISVFILLMLGSSCWWLAIVAVLDQVFIISALCFFVGLFCLYHTYSGVRALFYSNLVIVVFEEGIDVIVGDEIMREYDWPELTMKQSSIIGGPRILYRSDGEVIAYFEGSLPNVFLLGEIIKEKNSSSPTSPDPFE